MKRTTLVFIILSALSGLAFSGTQYSSKDMKQAQPAPCPEWYGDNEWQFTLWGTYAFTGTDYSPNLDVLDLVMSTGEGSTVHGEFDRYLGGDHAWGGGGDIQYFFHRYFGVGVEGFVVDADKGGFDIELQPQNNIFLHDRFSNQRIIGSTLGTFTLRYPIPCSRFAPYAWAGVGAIFGGGESDQFIGTGVQVLNIRTRHFDSQTELMGQFGYGLEIRFTRHLGWKNDFSWNVVDGPKNNFGMFRSGITFAF